MTPMLELTDTEFEITMINVLKNLMEKEDAYKIRLETSAERQKQ